MRLPSSFGLCVWVLTMALVGGVAEAADSPAFRGVRGDGHSDEQVPLK